MMRVCMHATPNAGGGFASVHGSLFRIDPAMQQYIQVQLQFLIVILPLPSTQQHCPRIVTCSALPGMLR